MTTTTSRVHFYFSAEPEDGDEFYLRKYKFNSKSSNGNGNIQYKLITNGTNGIQDKIQEKNTASTSSSNTVHSKWLKMLFG